MTLTSGTLRLGTAGTTTTVIRYEIVGSYGLYALSSAISAKNNGPAADSMRDFASYTHGTAPAAPSSCSVTWSTKPQVMTVSWTDNSDNETNFRIYRDTSTNPTTQINTDTSSPYVDSPTCGSTYYYRIRAWNTYGFSSYSNNDSAFAGCSCLLGNHSLMISPDEFKSVKELGVGDLIYTAHEHNLNEFGYYKISKYNVVENNGYYLFTLSNGDKIKCSYSHKFINGNGEVLAGNLIVGDKLMRIEDEQYDEVGIASILDIKEKVDVYQIEVADAHTYISENKILHHNIKE